MTDKSVQLDSSIELINDKLHFNAYVEGNEPISIDYVPPQGDNLGYTSLELLLLSLSSCVGSAVLTFLRKMKKNITGCQINAQGTRRTEHPIGFKKIVLTINLRSSDTSIEDLEKVISLAEDKYCPVWAMLKGNVEIEIKHKITA
jgi:putative redox protein